MILQLAILFLFAAAFCLIWLLIRYRTANIKLIWFAAKNGDKLARVYMVLICIAFMLTAVAHGQRLGGGSPV